MRNLLLPPRMAREQKTVTAMIHLYCQGLHGSKEELCSECRELQSYSEERLRKCRFQERKSTCAKCPVHCYQRHMRERIRVVMRYAGPRMTYRHPILAFFHLLDGWRPVPRIPRPRPRGIPEIPTRSA